MPQADYKKLHDLRNRLCLFCSCVQYHTKLGRAGIVDLMVNLSIPVYNNKKHVKKINKDHQEIKKYTYLNAKLANSSAIRQHATLITDQLTTPKPLKRQLTTRTIQTRLSLEKSVKTFMESRQETGPKAEKGEDKKE